MSLSSSSVTVVPHLRHLYVPFPGFSPVVGIMISLLCVKVALNPLRHHAVEVFSHLSTEVSSSGPLSLEDKFFSS